MKFEIDPNELTTEQRAHVAAFITNWPTSYGSQNTKIRKFEIDDPGTEGWGSLSNDKIRTYQPSEEQRLDAEQTADLREGDTTGELRDISGPEEAQAVNLTAIFGTPDVVKQMQENIVAHAELGAKIDSLIPLDSQGLPWDSRIHSSSKTTIADGSWKLRRGVDPAEVEKVKAQLKELMAVPVTDYISLPNEMTNAGAAIGSASHVPVLTKVFEQGVAAVKYDPVTDTGASISNEEFYSQGITSSDKVPFAPTSVGYVPAPPAPVIIPQLAEVKSHYLIDQVPPVTLTDLIGRMSKAIAENRLTQAAVKEMCVKHGVSEFHLLGNRPDLLPLIDADMKAMGI